MLAVRPSLLTLCLAFTLAALGAGCIIPFGLPPLRSEIGGVIGGRASGQTRLSTGVYVDGAVKPSKAASANVEAGIGLLYQAGDAMPTDLRETTATGEYVDLGFAPIRSSWGRVLVSARGERRRQRAMAPGEARTEVLAAKLRVDVEAFGWSQGEFSDTAKCGITSGAYGGRGGLGVYAEAGPAMFPDGREWTATFGVTVRNPGFAGAAVGVPCGNGGGGGSGSSSGSSGSSIHVSGG